VAVVEWVIDTCYFITCQPETIEKMAQDGTNETEQGSGFDPLSTTVGDALETAREKLPELPAF
jgi:hypothetical protein